MAAACRLCAAPVTRSVLDLGEMPLANSFPMPDEPNAETRYPLHARICDLCLLVQIEEAVTPTQLFADYAYLSSYSSTWLEHARSFADLACGRLGLDGSSFVVE